MVAVGGVRAIRPCLGARALGLGDMTIDRVAQRVRDRVDLLRPSSGAGEQCHAEQPDIIGPRDDVEVVSLADVIAIHRGHAPGEGQLALQRDNS